MRGRDEGMSKRDGRGGVSLTLGKGKAFNNTRVKHRVKRSIKVPAISNKLADMMVIHRGNMAKSQSRVLHTQDN
uniref:Zn-cluster domain-containing protein n=1 Tax=Cucumis melo TaxID=3656 RepID=A0A9I9E7F5_CUCME